MARLFFSYSRKDESVRDELEVHLAMLKRQGVINTWHDRRIVAGDEFDGAISEHLESADIILLLVSPYFLASQYCYDIEMKRAMERHAEGSARVIPVIVDPCDWHPAPFGKLLAMPQDAKPISKYPNMHDAFLEIAKAIRTAAESSSEKPAAPTSPPVSPATGAAPGTEQPRSSNLRLKKTFTQRDKDKFRQESFEYMAKMFEGSLAELEARHSNIETDFRQIDANTFTAEIYQDGDSKSECSICLSDGFGGNMIVYSSNKSSRGNSMNSSLSIVDDGNSLGLFATMFGFGGSKEQLAQHGAAEYFWSMLIAPLQR